MEFLARQLQKLQPKLIHALKLFSTSVITGLLFFYISANSNPSYGQSKDGPDRATIVGFRGTVQAAGITVRTTGVPLRSGQVLWIAKTPAKTPSNKRNWAKLKLQRGSTTVDPILQAGIDPTNTTYTFPCPLNPPILLGSMTIAWGLRQTSPWGCETIASGLPGWQQGNASVFRAAKNNSQVSHKEPDIAQQNSLPSNQVRVSRAKNLTLINMYNLTGKLAVDVLVGAVTVQAPTQTSVLVEAGNRYTFARENGTGNITPINVKQAAQSENIQLFLDSSTWSQDINPLISKLRVALSPPSTPTAGKPCTCSSDNPTLAGIVLRGVWEKSRRPDVQFECVGKWEGLGQVGGGGVRVPQTKCQ